MTREETLKILDQKIAEIDTMTDEDIKKEQERFDKNLWEGERMKVKIGGIWFTEEAFDEGLNAVREVNPVLADAIDGIAFFDYDEEEEAPK